MNIVRLNAIFQLVKFASPEAKKPTEEINEQELHIHR